MRNSKLIQSKALSSENLEGVYLSPDVRKIDYANSKIDNAMVEAGRVEQDGRCFLLDGVNDRCNLNSTGAQLNFITKTCVFSFYFWARLSNPSDESSNALNTFFGNTFSSALRGFGIIHDNRSILDGLGIPRGVRFAIARGVSGVFVIELNTGYIITDTNFHHYCVTGDGVTIKVYVDNVLRGSGVVGTKSTFDSMNYSAQIGALFNNTTGGLSSVAFLHGAFFGLGVNDYEITETQRTDIYNLKYTDNAICFYMCDDAAGANPKDGSGSGNSGVILDANLATFHNSTLNTKYSRQNEVGYSEGASGQLVPRDESNTDFDVDGNPLQYKGRYKYNFLMTQSNCLNFHSTDCRLDFQSTLLEVGDAISYEGTATISLDIPNNRIVCSAIGTAYNISIPAKALLSCSEGAELVIHNTRGVVHANMVNFTEGTAWSEKQDIYHHNQQFGNIEYYNSIALKTLRIPYALDNTEPIHAIPANYALVGSYKGSSIALIPSETTYKKDVVQKTDVPSFANVADFQQNTTQFSANDNKFCKDESDRKSNIIVYNGELTGLKLKRAKAVTHQI